MSESEKPAKKKTAKRRGRNEGSVFKRADGRWSGSVDLGYNAAGKRIRKTIYGKTRAEAHDKLQEELGKKRAGLTNPSKATVEQWIGQYLDEAKNRLRPRTLYNYKNVVEQHINPAIGKVKLAKLKPIHIDRIYRGLESAGKRGTAGVVVNILKPALRKARRLGMIASNPADDADPPSQTSSKGKTWTPAEAGAFLKAVKGNRDYALYYTAIYTGMRCGELCALKWEHVRLSEAELDVKHTIGQNTATLMGPPKTASSERTIMLPQSLVDVLHDHRKQSLAEGNASAVWVFPAPRGGVTWPNVIREKAKALMTKAGVPVIKFHEMRHYMPTSLLAADVNPKIVSQALGHSSVKMTLDVYSHVDKSHQRQVSNAMESLMAGVQAKRISS